MICEKIGENAGKIWRILHTHGPMTQTELQQALELDEHLFYAAVGWLARENKIHTNNDVFELNNTNLTEKIGGIAGSIWKILDMWDELDIQQILYLMKIDEREAYAGLGWLAREHKIESKPSIDDHSIRFFLK